MALSIRTHRKVAQRSPLRLINVHTYELEQTAGTRPRYAILSHTWGSGNSEISFDDWKQGSYRRRAGYAKVVAACEQARKDNLDYVWVDTCCIDKSSNAELSESINSMYQWYALAEVCYILLSDFRRQQNADVERVEHGKDPNGISNVGKHGFRESRYFKRGWTLQEMLAPSNVNVFDAQWTKIGSLSGELAPVVAEISGIDASLLRRETTLDDYSIPQKLSWAAGRETTRPEDRAYSLLGLLRVHMDLRYGEGDQAFVRLQHEILKQPHGLSVLAWPLTDAERRTDLLATSPDDYKNCGGVITDRSTSKGSETWMTSLGLKGSFPVMKLPGSNGDVAPEFVILGCHQRDTPDKSLALRITKSDPAPLNYMGKVYTVTTSEVNHAPEWAFTRLGEISFLDFEFVQGAEMTLLWQDSDDACNGLTSKSQLNLLVLGETGVGKSTFINAFFNYLTFHSLDAALESRDIICVIPGTFSLYTLEGDEYLERRIKVKPNFGDYQHDDEDEHDGSRGSSASQKTKIYQKMVDNTEVRLIDTPGIGDTRGPDEDRRNMQDVLRTLNSVEELHGIIILVKPNTARLTILFKFCLEELLTHLHKDAAKNIVFGFTNSRITSFKPGDTYPVLRNMMSHLGGGIQLNRSTAYFFDSESFRCLAANRVGVNIREMGDIQAYRDSWQRSTEETHRLLEHYGPGTTVAHQVQDSWSLNQTRELIRILTKPMADITQVIHSNMALMQDEQNEIAKRSYGDPRAIDLVRISLKARREKIDQFKKELATIQKAAAQFGVYLKRNSIKTHNDTKLQYLDILIEEERGKVEAGSSDRRLRSLQEDRKQHIEEVRTLTQYLERGENEKLLDREGIIALIKQLYTLENFGPSLQHSVKQIADIQRASNAKAQLSSSSPLLRLNLDTAKKVPPESSSSTRSSDWLPGWWPRLSR